MIGAAAAAMVTASFSAAGSSSTARAAAAIAAWGSPEPSSARARGELAFRVLEKPKARIVQKFYRLGMSFAVQQEPREAARPFCAEARIEVSDAPKPR